MIPLLLTPSETNYAHLMKSSLLVGLSMCTLKVTTSVFLLVIIAILTTGHLFTYIGKYPAIADDLVNSHHLLLCCVDTLYTSVVSLDRQDLLNPAFIGTHVYFVIENIFIFLFLCSTTRSTYKLCTTRTVQAPQWLVVLVTNDSLYCYNVLLESACNKTCDIVFH